MYHRCQQYTPWLIQLTKETGSRGSRKPEEQVLLSLCEVRLGWGSFVGSEGPEAVEGAEDIRLPLVPWLFSSCIDMYVYISVHICINMCMCICGVYIYIYVYLSICACE